MIARLPSSLFSLACLPVLFVTVCTTSLPLSAAQTTDTVPTQGQTAVAALTANHNLPPFTPPTSVFNLPATPGTQDLEQARLFAEPLFPVGGIAADADNAALGSVLLNFASGRDRSVLEAYAQNNPQSPWLASVLTNLGLLEFQDGYFSAALADWQQAWTLGKDETDRIGKLVIDRAAAELVKMYCRVGRVADAQDMLSQVEKRPFEGMTANMMHDTIQAVRLMASQPKDCFKCGPYALGSIVTYLNQQTVDKAAMLEDYKTTAQGTSLSDVLALSAQLGLQMQAAKRASGSILPLPCVVHWKLNHYGALLEANGDRYLLADPTFGRPAYVLADAVQKESDGYFLIPAGDLPAGWTSVGQDEAAQVFGRGQTSGQNANASKKTDGKTCHTPAPPEAKPPPGMAVWSFHIMLTSLHVEDTPVGYTPPVGPDVNLTVTYDHREQNQPSVINYSNFGPLWNFSWMSSITFDTANAYVAMGTGGTEIYSNFNSTSQSYAPERDSSAVLIKNSATSYERDDRDGSKMVFGPAVDPSGRIYLHQIVDAHGNALTLSYDSSFRLIGITDALNQVTAFTYGSNTVGDASFYLIAKVTDPFGRFAQFAYQNGELQSITDAAGNQSSFVYGANGALPNSPNNFIQALTTPYGTTNFTYTLSADGNTRSLLAQEPNGAQQRVDGTNNSAVPGAAPAGQVPATGYFYNGYLNYRNSLYWGRKAMKENPGAIGSAHIYHFFHDGSNVSEIVECEKQPLENWVWYAYQNQTQPQIAVFPGMLENVTQVGRVMDTGVTELTQKSYNSAGNLVQEVDPVGRTTNYSYNANGIDLATARQVTGAGTSDLLATYTWNGQHEPLTCTDRAAEQTQYSYTTQGQIQSVINSRSETTTFNYTGGYLTSIQGPVAGTLDLTTLIYDSAGRVATLTSGEGYALNYNYDNLDRLTKVTYPDTTFEQNTYTALDVTQKRDRQGRVTTYAFNGLRQMMSMTDANNLTTTYGWCACGSLASMTDANNHTTKWEQDIEGRPVTKTYADGTKELTAYENATSMVHSITDAAGQVKLYGYNSDGTLASVTYVNSRNLTAPVEYAYDTTYNRLTSMQDGIGRTTYSYYPVTGGVSPGAGRMSQIAGPWANSTVAYTYDPLNRVASRSINGVAEAFTYDPLGRVNNVTNALGSFNYTFENDSDRISTISVPNGQQVKYGYFGNSGDRRLTQIQNLNADSSNISTFAYPTYNPEGSINAWSQTSGTSAPVSYALSYDNTDQLLSGTAAGSSYGYAYDHGGNRTTETINGATTTSTYGVTNQLEQITPAKSQDKSYTWDAENRLISISYAGTTLQTQLKYDGLNRCAQIVELNSGVVQTTRRFVWCGTERCEERDGYDSVTKRFFRQGEQIYEANYYFFTDHLGSVRHMTDGFGTVRASYGYDFYGRQAKLGGDLDADFGFTSLFYHRPSKLWQAVWRHYDPTTGRWMSRDPTAEAGGIDLYTYASNDPTERIDLLGLKDYTALESQVYLSQAFSDAVAGPKQGLSNIFHNSTGRFDFKLNQPDDTFCIANHRLSAASFGNYIAGFAAKAYDRTYSPFGLPMAEAAVKAAGVAYHVLDTSNPSYDPMDKTGFPDINAGEKAAPGFLGRSAPNGKCGCGK